MADIDVFGRLVRESIEPAWTPARSRGVWRRARANAARRRANRALVGGLAGLGLAVVWWAAMAKSRASLEATTMLAAVVEPAVVEPVAIEVEPAAPPPAAMWMMPPPPPMALSDGSSIEMGSAETHVDVLHESPERIDVLFERGSAQFSVPRRPGRMFRLHIDAMTVAVIGARFSVDVRQTAVLVALEQGEVRVDLDFESVTLTSGQRRWFDVGSLVVPGNADPVEEPDRDSGEPLDESPDGEREVGDRRLAAAREAWREALDAGDATTAYAELRASSDLPETPDAEWLADAVEACRLSGHPRTALTYLRRLLDTHPEHELVAWAEFRLGELLLDRFKSPRAAAKAFIRARRADTRGRFAESAHVRAIEAWALVGDVGRVEALARSYREIYPRGGSLGAVGMYEASVRRGARADELWWP